MKSFKSNAWLLPPLDLWSLCLPKETGADYRHLRQRRSAKRDITYDPVHHNYIKLGNIEGKAFPDGKQIG